MRGIVSWNLSCTFPLTSSKTIVRYTHSDVLTHARFKGVMYMNLECAKKELILLLSKWQDGAFSNPWHIQDEAEEIEKKLIELKLLSSQNELVGLPAQIDAVLNQLTNAQSQNVLPKDIDEMKALLQAEDIEIENALKKYFEYWNSIDYQTRKTEINEYWF